MTILGKPSSTATAPAPTPAPTTSLAPSAPVIEKTETLPDSDGEAIYLILREHVQEASLGTRGEIAEALNANEPTPYRQLTRKTRQLFQAVAEAVWDGEDEDEDDEDGDDDED